MASTVVGLGRRTTHTYPLYRKSGVEWLGEVPEHWEVKRLEHVAFYRTSSVDKKIEEDELPVRLCNYTDVYYGDRIRVSEGEFMNATASTSEVQRFRLLVGDILVTKDSEDWRDIAVPAIVDETADDFVCGYHLGIPRRASNPRVWSGWARCRNTGMKSCLLWCPPCPRTCVSYVPGLYRGGPLAGGIPGGLGLRT